MKVIIDSRGHQHRIDEDKLQEFCLYYKRTYSDSVEWYKANKPSLYSLGQDIAEHMRHWCAKNNVVMRVPPIDELAANFINSIKP